MKNSCLLKSWRPFFHSLRSLYPNGKFGYRSLPTSKSRYMDAIKKGPIQNPTWNPTPSGPSSFRINDSVIIWTVIGLNGAVFLAWKYAEEDIRNFRNPKLFNTMYKHFVVSPESIFQGRIWTAITSAFSHRDFSHFAVNMFMFHTLGYEVLRIIGPSKFIRLYLSSAALCSAAHVVYERYIKPRLLGLPPHYITTSNGALGASGSVMGISTVFACLYPHATFYVFFVLPLPAYLCVGLFAAYDFYRAYSLSPGKVASAGHLGGGVYGIYYYFRHIRPFIL